MINFATDPVEKKDIAAALKFLRVLKNPRSRDIVGLYYFFFIKSYLHDCA